MLAQLALLLSLAAGPDAGPAFCGVAPPTANLGDEPARLLELVANSNQLVMGTVVRVNDATEPIHAPSPFVVHVDAWLMWPEKLAQPAELTFVAGSAGMPKIGERAYFAGHVQMEGTGIALMEDARFDTAKYPRLATDVPLMRDYAKARALYEQLAQAALVVRGRVQSVKTLPSSRASEHASVWAEAVVAVEESACGDHPATVRVRFDQSRDVANYQRPKLYTAMPVVLLLERDPASDVYAVPKPGELLEPSQWPLVKQLATTQTRLDLARPAPRALDGVIPGAPRACRPGEQRCISPVNGAEICLPATPDANGITPPCPVQ